MQRPLGIFVLHSKEDGCELLDIITPLKNLNTVIQSAQIKATSLGANRLYCLANESISKTLAQDCGKCSVMNMNIPAPIWSEGPRLEDLQNRWWIVGGDTDYL